MSFGCLGHFRAAAFLLCLAFRPFSRSFGRLGHLWVVAFLLFSASPGTCPVEQRDTLRRTVSHVLLLPMAQCKALPVTSGTAQPQTALSGKVRNMLRT